MTSAIILAGGRGTRLREAVPDRPKPMALVNRRPFLVHLLDYRLAQGYRDSRRLPARAGDSTMNTRMTD